MATHEPNDVDEIIARVEEKLSILDGQKDEIDRAVAVKRAEIKELRETIETLRALEASLSEA